MANADESLV
jgi:hypothetical protein